MLGLEDWITASLLSVHVVLPDPPEVGDQLSCVEVVDQVPLGVASQYSVAAVSFIPLGSRRARDMMPRRTGRRREDEVGFIG